MGYTTDFTGRFELDRELGESTKEFLTKFSETRRMARNVGPEFGVEGEFYVNGTGHAGQDSESNIIDYNTPPKTQPGLWCQWVPSEDGKGIEWNGAEKFYNYIEWLAYIINNFLIPKGYVLNGEVSWQGEESSDIGKIVVKDNKVTTTKTAKIVFTDED